MTRWAEFVGIPMTVAGLLVVALCVLRMVFPAKSPRCAGRVMPFWTFLTNPLRVLWDSGCRYDLAGCVPDAHGRVACPECGTVAVFKGWLWRWRAIRKRFLLCGVLVVLLGLTAWNNRAIRSGKWVPSMPTPVLLTVEGKLWRRVNSRIRDELEARLPGMSDLCKRWCWHRAAVALEDDEVNRNASWGKRILREGIPATLPTIEASLTNASYQRRQLAGWLIMGELASRKFGGGLIPDSYKPPSALLAVAVEGLSGDAIRNDDLADNAMTSVGYLWWHGQEASEPLAEAMQSSDSQQRMLSCAVAAACRLPGLQEVAAKELCRYLSSNVSDDDATLAFAAFLRMGPDAIPFLEDWSEKRPPSEVQGLATAELLVRKLRGEPLKKEEIRLLNMLTNLAIDPADRVSHWLERE